MSRKVLCALRLLPVILLLALQCSPARAADPFYERLLRDGTDAYSRGDYTSAAKYLRLAVFGFLEEPDLLAQGLSVLALSQARNEEQSRETILRIFEIEERFQAYSRATISPDTRDEFEKLVVRLMPRSTLASNSTFAGLMDRQIMNRLSELSNPQKRTELERLIQEYPNEPAWRLTLARLDLEDGRRDDAIQNTSLVLESNPDDSYALFVRGLAFAGEREWEAALADLAASEMAGKSASGAMALLRCYVVLEHWEEASKFLASLSAEVRNERQVQALARSITAKQ